MPSNTFETTEMCATVRQKLFWTVPLVIVSASGFLYIDAHASLVDTTRALPLLTAFDTHIPFVPEFIYAYFLYYPWLLLPLFVLRTRDAFFRALGAFALMQIVAQAFYIFLPSHMLRPAVVSQGFASDLVRNLYRLDLGWNVFPSLHVAHSSLVALLFVKYNRSFSPVIVFGTLLISASTVLIKQHYAIDIPAGMLLACICYGALWMPFRPARAPERQENAWDRESVARD